MELKISKQLPEFGTKIATCFLKKRCVVVEFPNCISTTTNKSFKWMPTYQQLAEIRVSLDEIEKESWNGV